MSVHDGHPTPDPGPDSGPDTAARTLFGDDRHCRHCHEISLAFDPTAGRPRCRSCGELA